MYIIKVKYILKYYKVMEKIVTDIANSRDRNIKFKFTIGLETSWYY